MEQQLPAEDEPTMDASEVDLWAYYRFQDNLAVFTWALEHCMGNYRHLVEARTVLTFINSKVEMP